MARIPSGMRKKENGLFEKRFTVEGKRYSAYGRSTIKKILQMQKTKMSMVYGEIHARKMDSNIFIGSNGAKVIASSTVSSAIDNVLKRLRQQGIEIERFTHHAFRDTFATRYIEEGGNMQTLQKILGHSSLAMTADLYAHVLPNTKQQEMQQIENGFIGVAVL